MAQTNKLETHAMLWFEEDNQATPLQAAQNAGRYFHQKYGLVPQRIALPEAWQDAATRIEEELDGLKVVVDKLVQPRHVAVSVEQGQR